jgi:WD40 repeat protein
LGTLRFRDGGKPSSITFNPDGKTLASAGPVRLWDAGSGKVRSLLEEVAGHSFAALSKDGKTLAVGGMWAAVRLWSLPPGKEPELVDEVSGGFAVAVALSPDGKWLAIGSEKKLFVWDVEKRKFRFQWEDKDETTLPTFEALAFSPDSKFLAFAGGNHHEKASGDVDIRLWSVETGGVVRKLQEHKRKVVALAFSPDGKMLASASREESIRVWDPVKGEVVRELPFPNCQSLAFAPDGKMLASAGYVTGADIRLWNPTTGDELPPIKNSGLGLTSLAFSPDGKTLAAAGGARAIRLWDVKSREEPPEFAGHWNPVTSVVFSRDGKTLASRSSDTTVRLWDLPSGRPRRVLFYGQHNGRNENICTLAFSSDGDRLVGLGGYEPPHEYAFFVWDAASGERKGEFETGRKDSWTATVSLAPDGDTVATADDYGIHLWSLASGKITRNLTVQHETPRGRLWDSERAVFSPDGRTLAAFDTTGHVVRVWDWKTGNILREIPVDAKFLHCLAFSPDGQLLAGCNPGPVCVWETATGTLLRKLGKDREGTRSVAFSADSRRLVVATNVSVDVWDVLTGEELSARDGKPLLTGGHKGAILCAAISPDGKAIASGGDDTTILLWDAADLLPKTPTADLGDTERDRLWGDLRSKDPAVAYQAILALLGSPDEAAALIKGRVAPEAKPDPKRVRSLLADLDSGDPDVREAASKELGKLGEAVEPDLRAALDGEPSEEAKARCKALLDALTRDQIDADGLRRLRAVQVLERLGTPEARAVLKDLAGGAPGRLSRAAGLALDRLDKRAP